MVFLTPLSASNFLQNLTVCSEVILGSSLVKRHTSPDSVLSPWGKELQGKTHLIRTTSYLIILSFSKSMILDLFSIGILTCEWFAPFQGFSIELTVERWPDHHSRRAFGMRSCSLDVPVMPVQLSLPVIHVIN